MNKHHSAGTKALVTLGVLVVCLGAREIPLPTITAQARFGRSLLPFQNLMELGAQPLLSGFILVEWAALLVPAWRPLRQGSPADRAKLRQASLIVGMLVALGQAFLLTLAWEKMGMVDYTGMGLQIFTIIILLGAIAVQAALARIVDEEGFGSGFTILVLAGVLRQLFRPIGGIIESPHVGVIPSSALPNAVFGVALLVGATLWLFSRYCLPKDETDPHPALVSRPACGVVPLTIVSVVLLLAANLANLNHPGAIRRIPALADPLVPLILGIVAAMLCAFLFNRPGRIAEAWQALSPNPPNGIPRLKSVLLESVLFIVLALAVQQWFNHRPGRNYVPHGVSFIVLTGIICDLVREWRAYETGAHLVYVWEIHQVYAVAPALRLLEAEGFHPFARGLRLRSLLQFFGPYVPVQILVPAEEAQAAYALLQARWPRWQAST